MVDSQKNGVIISVVVTDIQNVDQYHSHSSLLKWLPEEVVSPTGTGNDTAPETSCLKKSQRC
jgi:hypothetical protein